MHRLRPSVVRLSRIATVTIGGRCATHLPFLAVMLRSCRMRSPRLRASEFSLRTVLLPPPGHVRPVAPGCSCSPALFFRGPRRVPALHGIHFPVFNRMTLHEAGRSVARKPPFWIMMSRNSASPAIVTTVILNFVLLWNEYLYAVVLITDNSNRTLPLGAPSLDVRHWSRASPLRTPVSRTTPRQAPGCRSYPAVGRTCPVRRPVLGRALRDRPPSSYLASMCASRNFPAIDIRSALWISTLRSRLSIHAYSR